MIITLIACTALIIAVIALVLVILTRPQPACTCSISTSTSTDKVPKASAVDTNGGVIYINEDHEARIRDEMEAEDGK